MTISIKVDVPASADYKAEIILRDRATWQSQTYEVLPGDALTVYIYDTVQIDSIKEIPLNG